eukprot:COSAG02_NODE_3641_length_6437_cov_237.157936_7_plen_305_part_00
MYTPVQRARAVYSRSSLAKCVSAFSRKTATHRMSSNEQNNGYGSGSPSGTSGSDEKGTVRVRALAAKSEMMARRGAGGTRTKRYTDELGEHWVKQFNQFKQKVADPDSTTHTPYTGHSSGFRDANVELPPPPIDAALPTNSFESQMTQMSEHGKIAGSEIQHERHHCRGTGSSGSSLPSDLLRQVEANGSNASGNADPEYRSVAATPDRKRQMASSNVQLVPSDTGNATYEPPAQPSESRMQNQENAEAAKLLQQRSLGKPLVPPPTEMRPTELFVFPRGPHSMRVALTTPAAATDAVQLGSRD